MQTRYQPALDLARRFLQERLVSRIWDRDIGAWGAAPGSADSKSIATRLGWLDSAETMRPHLERVEALGKSARAEKIEAVYLLGMGGSSLCAEVLRSVLGIAEGAPQLYVLDTTDEQTLHTVVARMTPDRSWFIVAS